VDPYLVTNPLVLKDNDLFYMFYTSGLKKEFVDKIERIFYTIKLALSKDGVNFQKTNKVIFPLNDNEISLTRLSVLYDTEFMEDYIYKGWYCFIKKGYPYGREYRIGFALSKDLINWQRRDDLVGIDVGTEEYDIDMIAYPQVFKYNNKLFMLYNGNNFGKDGILYAISDIPKI